MADVRSPTVAVTTYGLTLYLSVSPTTVYADDTFTGTGYLYSNDGATSYVEAGRDVYLLNESFSPEADIGGGAHLTDTTGKYVITSVASIGTNVVQGTNEIQSRSYW